MTAAEIGKILAIGIFVVGIGTALLMLLNLKFKFGHLYKAYTRGANAINYLDIVNNSSQYSAPVRFDENLYSIPTDGTLSDYERQQLDIQLAHLNRDTMSISHAENALHLYVESCRRNRRMISREAIRIWSAAIEESRLRQARRRSANYQIQGGTLYGFSVITPEMLGQYNVEMLPSAEDPDLVMLRADGQQFWARRVNSTTLTIQNVDQFTSVLEEAQASRGLQLRSRTVMWEKEDDQGA